MKRTSYLSSEYKNLQKLPFFQASQHLQCVFVFWATVFMKNTHHSWQKSLWFYCTHKHCLPLWVYNHWEKMSWGVFPSCFLSSSGSSFSIQCHIHLSPIVLPVKGCIGIVSIFLYPLLQLTVIVKFFLQRKNKLFYDNDTWFHLIQTIQTTLVQGFLCCWQLHISCALTIQCQQKSKTHNHKTDSKFKGTWFILVGHYNHIFRPF